MKNSQCLYNDGYDTIDLYLPLEAIITTNLYLPAENIGSETSPYRVAPVNGDYTLVLHAERVKQ